MRWAVIAIVGALTSSTSADTEFATGTVVFARGSRLVGLHLKTNSEVEVATLGDVSGVASATPNVTRLLKLVAIAKPPVVRSLSTDGDGNVLLANLDGRWFWLPLDGSTKQFATLPCADGAATLTQDGDSVACRSNNGGSLIVHLRSNKRSVIDIPSARLTGSGANRKLVWADKAGVWSAPPNNRKAATRVAPQAPKRGFLASPDGTRAVGIYDDEVYVDARNKVPAEVLMSFALDGEGARRKAIRSGVAVEWSRDSQWVLVQDAGKACLMQATGGEYKCWAGYTAVSISSNGKDALLLGNRDRADPKPTKKSRRRKSSSPPTEQASPDAPPPTGAMALYRARLEGSAYTERPSLVTKIVDGAAVWIPSRVKSD